MSTVAVVTCVLVGLAIFFRPLSPEPQAPIQPEPEQEPAPLDRTDLIPFPKKTPIELLPPPVIIEERDEK